MIITYTTAYVRSLSSFGANVVEIFEVVERWVVVDVWVGVSINLHLAVCILMYFCFFALN